ncbi:MAG: hypothetical protein QM666_10345 [Acinetobacter sp.]
MKDISIENLKKLIKDFKKDNKDKDPSKLVIGYKAYTTLMNDKKFAQEVMESSLNPEKRKFQGMKIKITPNDYQVVLE